MGLNLAIIFAGGSGARMGSGLPKQFIEVNGKPIIIHTLDIFEEHPEIDKIYIACKEDYITKLEKYVQRHFISKVAGIVPGGATGQDSIYNALCAAAKENPEDSIVLIHDGVRPCITRELIDDDLKCVREKGSAVTCTPLFETPVVSKSGITVDEMPPRKEMFTAQAPQCFYLGEVIAAHHKMRETNPGYEGIVDTCTLMKKTGKEVAIVEGNRGNIKVTTPEDLYTFRAMIQYRETEQVFGFGAKEVTGKLSK
ncbi:2-C-methyl-D-erythritol 4-phosphate cytidylyltransferase [bacterium 210820-DFI.6.37]|nr:2-C-methyl-D-erythritol 4-phosphate cytidylyltransferase [bacterium 210820-DFI.6.37]